MCLISIAPFNSPESITLASMFVKPALLIPVTKSSASAVVESPGPGIVTVLAVSNAACPFNDSAILNVSVFTNTGLVVLLCIIVSPPSYLNIWKSATGNVVSVSSTAFCSATLNCV